MRGTAIVEEDSTTEQKRRSNGQFFAPPLERNYSTECVSSSCRSSATIQYRDFSPAQALDSQSSTCLILAASPARRPLDPSLLYFSSQHALPRSVSLCVSLCVSMCCIHIGQVASLTTRPFAAVCVCVHVFVHVLRTHFPKQVAPLAPRKLDRVLILGGGGILGPSVVTELGDNNEVSVCARCACVCLCVLCVFVCAVCVCLCFCLCCVRV